MSSGCSGKLVNNLKIIDNREFKNGCVTLYNDSKEKHNSWEARVLFETRANNSLLVIKCVVYEDTRENALNELQKEYTLLVNKFKEDFNISEPRVKSCVNCKYYNHEKSRCSNMYSSFYQKFMYDEDYCSKCWSLNEN
jgi:hypothetical protein